MFYDYLNNACKNNNWECFSPDEVAAACKQLQRNKKDADTEFNSSALINASSDIYVLLCKLINAIIARKYVQSK